MNCKAKREGRERVRGHNRGLNQHKVPRQVGRQMEIVEPVNKALVK